LLSAAREIRGFAPACERRHANVTESGQPKRPTFFDDPGVDWCWATITALSVEVVALRERLETLERILERKGGLLAGEIDSYEMDERESDARRTRRDEFTGRVFYVLDQEFNALGSTRRP
jgi:hypothetical protein